MVAMAAGPGPATPGHETSPADGIQPRPGGGPMIELRAVNKRFGELHVLRDVTLSVDRGEVVVVIGPSGSGKSTLLRCINRLESVDTGEVIVDGRSVTQPGTDVNALRREIGVVFQSF